MLVMNTAAVPPQDRFEYWREIVQRSALSFRVQPVDQPFFCELRSEAIGAIALLNFTGGVIKRYTRTRSEISRNLAPFYFAHLQIAGSCFIQGGDERPIAVAAGDAFFLDPQQEIDMEHSDSRVSLVVRFPGEWLTACVTDANRVHCTVVRHQRPFARLMSSYFRNGFEAAPALAAQAAALFGEHSVELAALALREAWGEAPAPAETPREALFANACRAIARQCAKPDLAPEHIAQQLHVSLRLLQRIFAEHEQTIMGHVWQERVRKAAQLLADPHAAGHSITQIAYRCGFNDSTHFGRVFAARMGMTPTEWRRQRRAQ